ncbi:hypothetical protein BDF14DRAFT_143020 [Spinellus fusiger]|nr:hypothetical protein BDF14DRAFT_143020 [Spinellus fusiger]
MTNTSATVEALRLSLLELGITPHGNKKDIKKQIRKAKKKGVAPSTASFPPSDPVAEDTATKNTAAKDTVIKPKTIQPLYDYYLFFDVEATCELGGGFDYPNEIIEFPVVLVDAHTMAIVSTLSFQLIHSR